MTTLVENELRVPPQLGYSALRAPTREKRNRYKLCIWVLGLEVVILDPLTHILALFAPVNSKGKDGFNHLECKALF